MTAAVAADAAKTRTHWTLQLPSREDPRDPVDGDVVHIKSRWQGSPDSKGYLLGEPDVHNEGQRVYAFGDNQPGAILDGTSSYVGQVNSASTRRDEKGDAAMSDPTAALKAAVARLIRDAQSLYNLFLHNYGNEANRQKLRDGFEPQGSQIKTNLRTLIGSATSTRGAQPLKSALEKPNSAYNQFISVWNNGTGDLSASFFRLNEFWTLLQAAEPELNRLMVPQPGPGPQPTPGPHGTPTEIQVFTTLRSQTGELYKVFQSCVATHTPSAAQRIKEHVNAIGELFKDTRLSRKAQTVLTDSKTEWGQFISLYKNGNGITQSCCSQLLRFQTVLNMDYNRFLLSS